MWSRELQGDVLQRKGGTSSQAGPLTATSPKVGTMPEEVTCRRGHKPGQRVSTGDGLHSPGELLGPKEEPVQGCLGDTPSCQCHRGSAGAGQGRGRCRWKG